MLVATLAFNMPSVTIGFDSLDNKIKMSTRDIESTHWPVSKDVTCTRVCMCLCV